MNNNAIEWEKLYTHSKEYATANGELEQYEESIEYTKSTATALAAYLENFYSDEKLPRGIGLSEAKFEYLNTNFHAELLNCQEVLEHVRAYAEDDDRIDFVLARTILSNPKIGIPSLLDKPFSSYFSEDVIEWARTIDTLDFIKDKEIGTPIFYHPAAVNVFAEWYIKNH